MAGPPRRLQEPQPDRPKSAIEDALVLTTLPGLGTDVFTNARSLWSPPGARGLYGGAVIAQCLSAAQQTVPADFYVNSMHGYFVLAGNGKVPVTYEVERVRQGRSFATRSIQAKQQGQCIFTTIISFVREGSGGRRVIEHAVPMPDVPLPDGHPTDAQSWGGAVGPFQAVDVQPSATDGQPLKPYEMKVRRWVRARDPISREGGPQAHLTALAYVSDRWFIGTAWVVHMASLKASLTAESALRARPLPSSHDEDNQPTNPDSPFKNAIEKGTSEDACSPPKSARDGHSDRQTRLPQDSSPKIGMMVSLDHSIYFHRPLGFRADDWLLAEMDSPWVGDGRGFVTQRIFNKEGVLVATCVQEGVVRLKQDDRTREDRSWTKSRL